MIYCSIVYNAVTAKSLNTATGCNQSGEEVKKPNSINSRKLHNNQ